MYCQVKLNAAQSDYSHCSTTFKIYYQFEFIVIVKLVLPSYYPETHFPYKNLVIAQVRATRFIMFIFCLIIY